MGFRAVSLYLLVISGAVLLAVVAYDFLGPQPSPTGFARRPPTPAATLTGRVTHADKPLPFLALEFLLADGDRLRANTDAAGRYSLDLPANAVVLGVVPAPEVVPQAAFDPVVGADGKPIGVVAGHGARPKLPAVKGVSRKVVVQPGEQTMDIQFQAADA